MALSNWDTLAINRDGHATTSESSRTAGNPASVPRRTDSDSANGRGAVRAS